MHPIYPVAFRYAVCNQLLLTMSDNAWTLLNDKVQGHGWRHAYIWRSLSLYLYAISIYLSLCYGRRTDTELCTYLWKIVNVNSALSWHIHDTYAKCDWQTRSEVKQSSGHRLPFASFPGACRNDAKRHRVSTRTIKSPTGQPLQECGIHSCIIRTTRTHTYMYNVTNTLTRSFLSNISHRRFISGFGGVFVLFITLKVMCIC